RNAARASSVPSDLDVGRHVRTRAPGRPALAARAVLRRHRERLAPRHRESPLDAARRDRWKHRDGGVSRRARRSGLTARRARDAARRVTLTPLDRSVTYGAMMEPEEVRARLLAAFPDADIDIVDLTGTRDHYQARIVSDAFEGKAPLEQHQLVYRALGEAMNGPIHALALKTYTRATWAKVQSAKGGAR